MLGLFWELEPSRTLSIGPLHGVKKSKKRVTLLLTINATGSVKLPPLFINKNKTPRDMIGIDKSKLPVDYYWNEKAWMQVSIWNLSRMKTPVLAQFFSTQFKSFLEPFNTKNYSFFLITQQTHLLRTSKYARKLFASYFLPRHAKIYPFYSL